MNMIAALALSLTLATSLANTRAAHAWAWREAARPSSRAICGVRSVIIAAASPARRATASSPAVRWRRGGRIGCMQCAAGKMAQEPRRAIR